MLLIPVNKHSWRFHTLNGDINPNDALDIALNTLQDSVDIVNTYRMKGMKSYKMLPLHLRFYIIKGGQPNVEKPRQIMEWR